MTTALRKQRPVRPMNTRAAGRDAILVTTPLAFAGWVASGLRPRLDSGTGCREAVIDRMCCGCDRGLRNQAVAATLARISDYSRPIRAANLSAFAKLRLNDDGGRPPAIVGRAGYVEPDRLQSGFAAAPAQRPLSCNTRPTYFATPGTSFSGGRPALIHRSSLPRPQL